ncbi:DNA polymerase lambda isoform X3 [Aquila chrysaetos chrysaetos]|uniref:DNA polymerase lambda n=1 Tax=Aquila chrysaetos chrysaetos TaxID=223781 RepID=A0A663ENT4_AQUCH|nr:DNA polymerase lambda isoform X3 [Aquila chrysaetos chrysaetos]XP_029886415.1 DNA polymerase lambda isoform X3 [Aquila chrysaetos chrysaetos]XP_029886416.1 DNA polymerase lambda isoform X3 [Aquila chrysaetos chrysaetos]XP_029886417.1 DNA polymerase lambda isoform X3 [Aquila chrysaetos chrysaetos]
MEPRGIVKAFPKRKKVRDDSGKSAPPKIPKEEGTEIPEAEWLKPVTAYVLQAGIGQARAEIFHKQIVQNGGVVHSQLSLEVTHVIVAEDMDCDRAFRLLKLTKLPSGLQLVKASWLSACIRNQKLLSTAGHAVLIPRRYLKEGELQKEQQQQVLSSEEIQPPAEEGAVKPNTEAQVGDSSKQGLGTLGQQQLTEKDSADEDSEGEDASVTQGDLEALISGCYPVKASEETSDNSSTVAQPASKWVCAQSSNSKKENHNQCITEKLEVLAKAYSVQGDKWRALGYSKAINALKSYHKPVTSYQEACKIPGIGKRMAEKILEILESGHLRKLDHISESVPVLELFSHIWGAGVKTAQMWYQQGFRTLDDIRTKATLTSQQAVGLKHYTDFLERMPREEAAEIEQTVRQAALALKPGLVCVACGSYRRGKPTCGDVDVLVTHPDGQSHRGVFSKLLDSLHRSGFLTDDLVSQEDNGDQKKYLGVCRLPGQAQRHRRLDIIVVPYSEFACALLYFTGSAHFNRSMRALAKTKGMSLSEHALSSAVVRGPGGVKLASGHTLPTPTERDVFIQLGLPYREPSERDW